VLIVDGAVEHLDESLVGQVAPGGRVVSGLIEPALPAGVGPRDPRGVRPARVRRSGLCCVARFRTGRAFAF